MNCKWHFALDMLKIYDLHAYVFLCEICCRFINQRLNLKASVILHNCLN